MVEVEQQRLQRVDEPSVAADAAGVALADSDAGWHVLAIEAFELVAPPATSWSAQIEEAALHQRRAQKRRKRSHEKPGAKGEAAAER